MLSLYSCRWIPRNSCRRPHSLLNLPLNSYSFVTRLVRSCFTKNSLKMRLANLRAVRSRPARHSTPATSPLSPHRVHLQQALLGLRRLRRSQARRIQNKSAPLLPLFLAGERQQGGRRIFMLWATEEGADRGTGE